VVGDVLLARPPAGRRTPTSDQLARRRPRCVSTFTPLAGARKPTGEQAGPWRAMQPLGGTPAGWPPTGS